MHTAVQVLAIINFAVIGLSHALQPQAWSRFFGDLAARGTTGVFLNAMLHLVPGTLIVAFHNVWTGVPVILTLIGWGFTVKGALYLFLPSVGTRSLKLASQRDPRMFVYAGLLLLLVALALAVSLLSNDTA